jgi:hypothetical protein
VKSFARAVSIFGHPFVTLPIAIAYAASGFGLPERVTAIVIGTLAVSLGVVSIYSLIKVRRGEFSNIDVSTREQRPRFYAVLISSTLASALVFHWLKLPERVVEGTCVSAGLMSASLLVNYRLKCSLHVAYTVFPLAIIWRLVDWPGRVCGIAFVLLMMWSRVTMGRHTRAETIAGAILGSLAGLVLNLL